MSPAGVVLASGHMIDDPNRGTPRFPPEQEHRVTLAVRRALERWGVGAPTTIICGGARGADLIVAEQARELGADIVLCLAEPPDDFVTRSVELPGTDWTARFRAMCDRADVRVLPDERAAGGSAHTASNTWMIELARQQADRPHDPRAIVVWDGRPGDGTGGTRDFVRQLGITRPDERRLVAIDPTPRRYERRQRPGDLPKRLLSLDGGGTRGIITLEILHRIERRLATWVGRPDLRLADYFDVIGGTGSGAVIAAGLAAGERSTAELLDHYEQLCRTARARRFPHRPTASRSPQGSLDEQLDDRLASILGGDRTLGDPSLRSLLLIVLHDTTADSVGLLGNHTGAEHNRVDRCLLDPPDRRLDLPLVSLLRASIATPENAAPEAVRIGSDEVMFRDAGLTPFNNPALLAYLMVTTPAAHLEWRSNADDLLVVSVGTGAPAMEHPTAGTVTAGFTEGNPPSVFASGGSTGQDVVCRALGHCRFGPEVGGEVSALIGDRRPDAAFSYVRYDADLSDSSLTELGITSDRTRSEVRGLDGVGSMDELRAIGRAAADSVDLAHLEGFLGDESSEDR